MSPHAGGGGGAACDAGASCGFCLTAINATECPQNPDLPNCFAVEVGDLCEGDGECDTLGSLDNCVTVSGNWDVYRKSVDELTPTTGEWGGVHVVW